MNEGSVLACLKSGLTLLCVGRAAAVSVLDTFRLLIKHSYGVSYANDQDGKPLGVEELLALVHVANAFEFMGAVKECVGALKTAKLTWEQAVQCVELARCATLRAWMVNGEVVDAQRVTKGGEHACKNETRPSRRFTGWQLGMLLTLALLRRGSCRSALIAWA